MLVSAIQRQEVRSDTISSSDVQQNQPITTSSSTATAAMQMQQQQHNQMIGTGGVQIVPFVNTDGSIQPINLVPQQLSVSSMQQFQMLQQNQHPFMVPQQYAANVMQFHASKPHIQGQTQSQQVAGSTQGVSTPPIPSQQTPSFQVQTAQQMRPITQSQTQINTQVQQQTRAQVASVPQSQSIRPLQQTQQYQAQQPQQIQAGGQLTQPTATIAQETQPRYSQSVPASSQMMPQNSTSSLPAAHAPLQQAIISNVSSQPHNISSSGGQQQSVTSASQIQGTRVDEQGSGGNTSQPNTTPHQQQQQPTYYFAPQPTYPMMHGINEASNAVASTQWPQMQAMAFIPQQSGTQMMHTSQPGVSSIATTSAGGEGGNTLVSDGRQPSVAAHAFHHYQNGSSHSHIPHQLVLVPQPQNFTYLPHSGGHIPLPAYQQAAGLHSMPPAAGFAPLQPAVGHTSTSSPTPSAVSQQQTQSQAPSTPSFTKPLQQGPQQPIPISAVNILPESSGTVVTSAHAQVVPTHTTNHPAAVTGQQQVVPILPQAVPQMQQPQYQASSIPALQPLPQQLGMPPHSMMSGHQQQHVQLPVGGMMHATTATGSANTDLHNDRGISSTVMDSSLMNQSQPQAGSSIPPASIQHQLSASSQSPQPPSSTSTLQ